MERKEIALYITLGILLIETVTISWVYWNKDTNERKKDTNEKSL